jgi:hypothetical protein
MNRQYQKADISDIRKPNKLLGPVFDQVQELPRKPVPEAYLHDLLLAVPCRDISYMLLSGDSLPADGAALPMGVTVAVNSVFCRHTTSAASCRCLSTQKDKIQNVLGF